MLDECLIVLQCYRGNYAEALSHYERGLLEAPPTTGVPGRKPHPDQENHNSQCQAGVARTAIHCGDIRRGVSLAADMSSSRQLKRECAEILEGVKVSQNMRQME
jgi:WD repeat-containing protein 19